MASLKDARTRRKGMLADRLEPKLLQVVRVPYDSTMAKSGVVEYLDVDDNMRARIIVRERDGRIVIRVGGTDVPVDLVVEK